VTRKPEVVAEPAKPTPKRPELRISRTFDAPRQMVFDAWAKAEHLARWFTPKPLTTSKCEVDLRPGGVFRVTMRMPNGVEHAMQAKFVEVVAPERIVFAGAIPDDNDMETTVTFSEEHGKTRIDVLQTFAFESDATRGAQAGWTATLDQLGQHVAA
jgi:uncharacterized protein YndB with AHSA1/START domain